MQFTKALNKDGDRFTYLCQDFPGLAMEKLKACIFDGTQIRQLIRDPEFENSMNEVELEARKTFVLVMKDFLGSNKARNYAELVKTCWMLSETWAATWTSRCTTNFHIWTGFLRTRLQWVTSKGRDSIRTWKRWRPGIRVPRTQLWWLVTVGIWRKTSLPLSIPGAWKNGSSSLEVWTMVKHHGIYVYLPLSMPTIQFTVINVSIR